MGRQVTAEELLIRAEAKGYKRGAHTEQDEVRNREKHVKKTMEDHDRTLQRYVMWHLGKMQREATEHHRPLPTVQAAHEHCLRVGVAAPDLATVKDFFRFYIATSSPKIANVPTVESINTVAEWFFAGFTRVTGTDTDEEERSEVYNWVRKVLTREGLVVNKRRQKHNFQPRDLVRILLTLWTKDDLIYIPERYRIQFTFIVRVYCWTGARLSAFFTNGLRYRDVHLVLQRTPVGRWKLIYRIDQRWVKNNRDPENIVFGTAGREHDHFIYDDSAFLLTMALADGALFGFRTLADLQEQEIPVGDNELVLRFKADTLDKPILRKCTKADGVLDAPMPKSAFSGILRTTLRNAGYLCPASIHAIRRGLGKKVDEIYTEVQRSQHLTQADPRIFGQSYVANTSSVDGQAAFLGEQVNHSHIDYFQSLEKFREPGLPCELPAHMEEGLKHDRRRRELESEVQELSIRDPLRSREAKKNLTSYVKTLKGNTLRQHQTDWIQRRRDWKIITRGKEQASDLDRTDLVQSLCLLFPERARLAQRLASNEPLSAETKWFAMEDLQTLCARDSPVLYLPDCQPVNERCPVECCQLELVRLPRDNRNQHIQACVRREIASKGGFLYNDVHYCHLCFSWVVGGSEWEAHCSTHLQKLDSKRCGTIKYCHTAVRRGYCPFCLWCTSEPAGKRLESWCRDQALWAHIDTHIDSQSWPRGCPDPRCKGRFADTNEMRFHLIDEHGLPRPGKLPPSKRKVGPDDELFVIQSEDFWSTIPAKKRCRNSSTVVPSVLSKPADKPLALIDEHVSPPHASSDPSPLKEADVMGFGAQSNFNDTPSAKSPIDSDDSTLLNSPVWNDSLFDRYLRSPSPEGGAALVNDQTQEDMKPESGLDPTRLPDVNFGDGAFNTQKPNDAGGKISIRLRLGVEPTPAPPATKIVLRCATQQRKGQHERRTKSLKMKPVKTSHTSVNKERTRRRKM